MGYLMPKFDQFPNFFIVIRVHCNDLDYLFAHSYMVSCIPIQYNFQIWCIDGILKGTGTQDKSGPGSNDSKEVSHAVK